MKTTPPPPPPRWTKPPLAKTSISPKSEALAFIPINKASQNGNITVTTTVTFSVNNTQTHNNATNESIQNEKLQLTLASNTVNNRNNMNNGFNVIEDTKHAAECNGNSQVRINGSHAWRYFYLYAYCMYEFLLKCPNAVAFVS